jgi:hypothetical protein
MPSRDTFNNGIRAAWQSLIDYRLIELGCHSEQIDDEGVSPPSRAIVQIAIQLAERFRDAGFLPPSSVVPDANGGIVFERREENTTEVFHIWDDGEIEYQRFEGSRLVERRPM